MPDDKPESRISGTGLEQVPGAGSQYARPEIDYGRPEVDDDLAVSGEEPASPAMPLDRSVDRVEMERLRELLREQQEATLHAINTAADLQSQLSTAQTEVKKIGKQYHGFSKQARAAASEKAAEEIAKANSERHEALRELERQKQESRAEAIRAAAQLSRVREELTASSVAGGIPHSRPENRRVRHATIAIITAVAVVGSAAALWRTSFTKFTQSHPSTEMKDSPAPVAVMQTAREYPSKSLPVASSAAVFPNGLSPEPAAALASAMTQLDIVLSSFPGRKPEDILREASKKDHSCRMEWNDGNPSLLFGSGASSSLSSTITQCAEAAKRLH
jgi:hypothetical protein